MFYEDTLRIVLFLLTSHLHNPNQSVLFFISIYFNFISLFVWIATSLRGSTCSD